MAAVRDFNSMTKEELVQACKLLLERVEIQGHAIQINQRLPQLDEAIRSIIIEKPKPEENQNELAE